MLSVRTELRYQCKQTVASTLITDPLVKTPLPAAKLLKRQLLVFSPSRHQSITGSHQGLQETKC